MKEFLLLLRKTRLSGKIKQNFTINHRVRILLYLRYCLVNMTTKITDLAKKLNMSSKGLRGKIAELGIPLPPRAQNLPDDIARKIIYTLKNQERPEEVVKTEETIQIVEQPKIGVPLPGTLTVNELAKKISVPIAEIIKHLLKNGIVATINDYIDFDVAAIIADDLNVQVYKEEEGFKKIERPIASGGNLIPRPPIVTIMGHVDHGKTTLLDFIRKTNVVSEESGGITQHIGAYQADVKSSKWEGKRSITFLDTPGHEAFTAMRAHGAMITDVAVLVVAADDGVRPQTIEAINHARAAEVPIVVAINKIDKPGADPEKVKRELADQNLLPEEWGGNTIMLPVSAKSGQGVETLLEMIILVADMLKLKADPDVPATGVVIESKLSMDKGPLATILIQNGTLSVGDVVVIGDHIIGKVRLMQDFTRKKLKQAPPSTPVRIAGLDSVPRFSDTLQVFPNVGEAKKYILESAKAKGRKTIGKKIGIAELSEAIRAGQIKELKIILKGDFMGSLEAIESSLLNLKTEEVAVKIIHKGVGSINESDVMMAQAGQGLIIGFKVGIIPAAKKLADAASIKISIYEVIYELLDDITAALSGLLEPEIVEEEIGKGRVLKIFKDSKTDKILGVRILEGKLQRGALIRIKRNEEVAARGKITSIKRETEDVQEATKGIECGIGVLFQLEPGQTKVKILEDDTVEAYIREERIRKLKP